MDVRSFIGRWRIVEMELWNQEDLDLVSSAHITFEKDGLGELQMIAVNGGIDYRVAERGGKPAIEFSWEGFDEMDPASGRGWAILDQDRLCGRLFFHLGDDSSFVAERER